MTKQKLIKKIVVIISILVMFISIPFVVIIAFYTQLDEVDDDESLYIQKIKNSRNVLIDYDVWYGRDGHVSGFTVLDSTAVFNFRTVTKLPMDIIDGIPNNKIIKAVNLIKSRENNQLLSQATPESIKIDDIQINIYHLKHNKQNNLNLYQKYRFTDWKETVDSIFFYNLESVFVNDKPKKKIALLKGNIYLSIDSLDYVRYIIANELINTISNSKSKNDSTEHITCIRKYHLIPKNKIHQSEISENGVFR